MKYKDFFAKSNQVFCKDCFYLDTYSDEDYEEDEDKVYYCEKECKMFRICNRVIDNIKEFPSIECNIFQSKEVMNALQEMDAKEEQRKYEEQRRKNEIEARDREYCARVAYEKAEAQAKVQREALRNLSFREILAYYGVE